jgi:hypothetical protein
VDFDVTDQQLIRSFAFVRYWGKKWEYNKTVHQLFIHFKKAYGSVSREVLYNKLIEFGITKKLVSLIKMCLIKTYNEVFLGEYLPIRFFYIKRSKTRRCFIASAFQLCFRICH